LLTSVGGEGRGRGEILYLFPKQSRECVLLLKGMNNPSPFVYHAVKLVSELELIFSRGAQSLNNLIVDSEADAFGQQRNHMMD